MPTYADYRAWVISTIAGWFEVTADTPSDLGKITSNGSWEFSGLSFILDFPIEVKPVARPRHV
jgi:hypothetical protein